MATSNQHVPRVSIGVPVYNGENFLADALDSVLAQTFDDFELVVSDNASTDRTEEICRDYAARDPRVRVFRNAENLGAARNYNLTFEHARGRYFKWLAHDDALTPECLARCVAVLDADPTVVLCHGYVRIIDGDGRTIGRYQGSLAAARADSPVERFGELVRNDQRCTEIFGLVRSDALARTPLIGAYIASDRILRAELALHGRFEIVERPLFVCREHDGRSVVAMPAHHLRAAWFDPRAAGRKVFPHWRVIREYVRCVRRSPVDAGQKRACYARVARWPGVPHNAARLMSDIVIAARPESWRLLYRLSGAAVPWFEVREEEEATTP